MCRFPQSPDERVGPEARRLDAVHVDFLVLALSQFGGPSRCSDEAAGIMDLADAKAMREWLDCISPLLRERQPMARRDWHRALIAAELSYVSDVYGAGRDWTICTGLTELESISALRDVQRRLGSICFPHFDARDSDPGPQRLPPYRQYEATLVRLVGRRLAQRRKNA